MSLKNIVAKTAGDLWAAGAQANIPAPGHSSVDRSVSLLMGKDGKVRIEYPPGLAQDWNEAAGYRVVQPWMSTEPASL